MRTKVYTFKPKGRGTVYATKTYRGVRLGSSGSSSSRSSKRGGIVSDYVSGVLARFIVHGIFGMKK